MNLPINTLQLKVLLNHIVKLYVISIKIVTKDRYFKI